MKFTPHKVAQLTGDECVRCSVASLLGLSRDEVPNFMATGTWYKPLQEWLSYRGLEMDVYDHTLEINAEYYLGQGHKNGVGHCVVMRDGEVWHDPSGLGMDQFETWLVIRQSIRDIEPTFYASILPHLKKVARDHGYALALHGSLQRDMDVIAVPWIARCSDPEKLVDAIQSASNTFQVKDNGPTQFPHGRRAWQLFFGGHHYLDLSVIPPTAS